MAHYHCHYGFSYNLFSHMLCDFTPHFVRPSVLCLVGCLLPPKWSSDLKYGSCPPACTLDSCVSSLIVIRCALSFCISYSVIHCSITIKNGQNGNTGIRHNRKKTISPLRSVIAGFHCNFITAKRRLKDGKITIFKITGLKVYNPVKRHLILCHQTSNDNKILSHIQKIKIR